MLHRFFTEAARLQLGAVRGVLVESKPAVPAREFADAPLVAEESRRAPELVLMSQL